MSRYLVTLLHWTLDTGHWTLENGEIRVNFLYLLIDSVFSSSLIPLFLLRAPTRKVPLSHNEGCLLC